MRSARLVSSSAFFLLAALPAFGQDDTRELVGELYLLREGKQAREPLANVEITVPALLRKDNTTSTGRFRLSLPSNIRREQSITIRQDRAGHEIVFPLFGELKIPSDPATVVEVELIPRGSKLFWADDRQIKAFIIRIASTSPMRLESPHRARLDFTPYIQELAEYYGFEKEDVTREIQKWVDAGLKDSTDFYSRGLRDFASQNFGEAARNFLEDAARSRERGAKSFRESARSSGQAGDSLYFKGDYQQALEQYRTALKDLETYRDSFGNLGKKVDDEYAADTANLTLKAANARAQLGEQIAGPDSRMHLEEAVRAYRELIEENSRAVNPGFWARTQNNLGVALDDLGGRLEGAAGASRLLEAVIAYRVALDVYTRAEFPQQWAMVQNNLGTALDELGARLEGAAGEAKLQEAIDCFRAVLKVHTRTEHPQDWARAQHNLGAALGNLGGRLEGAAGEARLEEAIAVCRAALEVHTRTEFPQQWAMTQDNRGIALYKLGCQLEGAAGVSRLQEAVAAYRDALEVYTRADFPRLRAATQIRLGGTLQVLFVSGGPSACLTQLQRLASAPTTRDDTHLLAPVLALSAACHIALGHDGEARHALDDLVSLIERQNRQYRLAWEWGEFKNILDLAEDEGIKRRRQSLLGLVDAVSRDHREAILEGLKQVRATFKD